jgi:pimeloyl-ACP methyl ester carboxylesterase
MMGTIRCSDVTTNGVRLHLAEAGPAGGPALFLLHGFPEIWQAWEGYIAAFAAAGFHVIAPDQRGYDTSEKPLGVRAYDLDQLAADITGLADHFGAGRFSVIGHDWGGIVGWWIATRRRERLDRLAVINAPHPSIWREAMTTDPEQRRRSRYVKFFRLPWLPELLLRRKRFAALRLSLERTTSGPTGTELDRYIKAWTSPGALTAMLNWYRALLGRDLPRSADVRLNVPVLMLWGERDPYGVRGLAQASLRRCERGSVIYLPQASHWVQHEEQARCCAALLDFLAQDFGDPQTSGGASLMAATASRVSQSHE